MVSNDRNRSAKFVGGVVCIDLNMSSREQRWQRSIVEWNHVDHNNCSESVFAHGHLVSIQQFLHGG